MFDKVYSELDPILETMGLLYVSHHFDEMKEEIKKSLSELGFDGEKFYKQNLSVYDKYVSCFMKCKVSCISEELFWGGIDSNYFLILLLLIKENRSWLSSTDELTDEEINRQIIYAWDAVFDESKSLKSVNCLEDIIVFLDNSSLDEKSKWRLMRIMQQPKKHILELINAINTNIDAFKKTEKDNNKAIKKLLSQYNTSISSNEENMFYENSKKLLQGCSIYPTLIYPLSQMIFEKSCYYGLLSAVVIIAKKGNEHSKESLLLKLKALSDSSKLEILISLNVSPKYNLEIAKQLGLTAATMSHHMNVLLSCGFVGVEKNEGKVYYHIQKDNIKDFIDKLEQVLL